MKIVGRVAALALVAGVPRLASAASAPSIYYERQVMVAADARCRLFSPEIASALSVSTLQAKGAALRAGSSAETLRAVAERARVAAYSTPCDGPDLRRARDRVRDAFAGYARTTWMNFPGELGTWQAERRPTAPVVNHKAVEGPRWRLQEQGRWSNATGPAPLMGIADNGSVAFVLAPVADAERASSAVLIVRNPDRSAEPYLRISTGDMAGRAPPSGVTHTFIAASKVPAPLSLTGKGRSGTLFGFGAAAIGALEALDPREVVAVELTFPDRPSRRALFEVGDFAAARAFLAAR